MPTLNVEATLPALEAELALPPQTQASPRTRAFIEAYWKPLVRAGALLALSLLAIAINGYHPYSEDAGIYVAGIKQAARPGLYGSSADFVTASSHLSQFSYLNALLAQSLRISLDDQLMAMQVLTTWLLLYACWRIGSQCFPSAEARWASVSLVAVCLSVPVAGSSLFMMDPYVTARSFSTPLTLLAIDASLEGRMGRSVLLLALITLFHPLMSLYAAGFLLLLWAIRQRSWAGTAALMVSALAAGAAVQFSQRAVTESPAYRAAVATRFYFFLSYWKWYELFGLAAPLALLGAYCLWRQRSALDKIHEANDPAEFTGGVLLARTCIAIGLAAVAVSLLFIHPQSHSHLLAAMQPMRAFVLVYLCMFLLLGGALGEFWLKRVPGRWAAVFAALALGVGFAQHQSYPGSAHLELPGSSGRNPWNRAFLWIRANTPVDALFALDCDYIHAPGEDAQGFRAIAERGSLADFSKDGGAAAVFPQLAERWMSEHLAQAGLNAIDDAERMRRLLPLHVSWMVLDRHAATAMPCPFVDDAVKVCRLQ